MIDQNQITWVSAARASIALELDEQAIYRLIREGKFPFRVIRLGRLIRISAADLGLIDSANSEAPINQVQTSSN